MDLVATVAGRSRYDLEGGGEERMIVKRKSAVQWPQLQRRPVIVRAVVFNEILPPQTL